MDSKVELYLKRARTEMNMGVLLLKSSGNKLLNDFDIPEDETFYSGVISHCYYSIFYSAKAMLFTKKIDTKAPEVHKKTLDEFKKHFIDSGILDMKLFMIYKKMIINIPVNPIKLLVNRRTALIKKNLVTLDVKDLDIVFRTSNHQKSWHTYLPGVPRLSDNAHILILLLS